MFKEGFDALERKLSERYYISVAAFSADIGAVFSSVLAKSDKNITELRDVTDVHNQLNEVPAGTAEHHALTQEQKELKKLTKRIVKAVKDPLENAMKKEAELKGIPFEKEMNEWAAFDARLENSIQSNHVSGSILPAENGDNISPDTSVSAIAGASPGKINNAANEDIDMPDADAVPDIDGSTPAAGNAGTLPVEGTLFRPMQPLSPPISTSSAAHNLDGAGDSRQQNIAPPAATSRDPWARGGVPWYLDAFDINGTTIHEERWTGPETMRAMSEQLSEMDEETLLDLCEQTNPSTEEDNTRGRTRSSARIRRAEENDTSPPDEEAEEQEAAVEETEEEKAAREKRDKANARRRAQRRRNRY